MATPFKPTRPYRLPTNPEIVTRGGKPHLRLSERGKTVFYPLSKDGMKYLKPTTKWYGEYRDAVGALKRVPLSPNKDAARLMLADLLRTVEREKTGHRDVYAPHRKTR